MRRRDFLKRLAATGTSVFAGGRNAFAALAARAHESGSQEQQQSEPAPVATAIRGLVERNGQLFQPVQIALAPDHPLARRGGVAVVRIDGEVRDRPTIVPATRMIEVLAPAVDAERSASVTVESAEASIISGMVALKPARKVLVYVLPHSHNDIGYTDLQANVEKKQLHNLQLGIDLARKTADYPEGARFVWNLEGCWAPDMWMRRTAEVERGEFVDAVVRGWVALNGMYANELTGLCGPEELLQLFRRGTELGKLCGVHVDSAMISDVPGFTWGTATAMAQAGIRYFSAAPNWFDRIGDLMQVWQDKPFWWIGPSGRERVLVWVPWTGYAMSHVFKEITPDWVGKYQDRLDEAKFPYDISYIRWSGHGDNAEPDPQICEDIKAWNAKYAWPKFYIASTSKAFAAFEERHGKELPEFKGDLTPYWEDGAGSSALETGVNRNTAERLVQAEALFAMSGARDFPVDALTDAWRNVLLCSEHTWGAWNSVSDSENKFVKDQWEMKRTFAVEAARQSRQLLDRATGYTVGAALRKTGRAFDVYNTTSWARSELVVLEGVASPLDHVTDPDGNSVPSQRLSNHELAIWVTKIPPFASARFGVSTEPPAPPNQPVEINGNVLDNGVVRVRVNAQTGGISQLYYEGREENLVDTRNGDEVNQFLYLPGDDLAELQSNGAVQISIAQAGPLVAELRIECEAPGCNSLVRAVRLAAGSDCVELTNIVDKKRAAMNPNPGKGGPGDDWAQHGGKESIQFGFPFNVRDGQIRMDIPLAVMRPEIDQLPGACKNWLPVGRWIDVANESYGVTWATLDAPLVEIGEISARMLGSQHNPDIWRKHIEPTQKFYSWVMNNHWGTNYRAYQEGVVTFRYALRPHHAYDAAAAARFAKGLSQPLIAVPTSESGSDAGPTRSPFLRVEPDDVVVSALKPSDDGTAWIVRLFGASGKDREATLTWSSPPNSVWISDLSEKRGARAGDTVTVHAWELVTLRAERR